MTIDRDKLIEDAARAEWAVVWPGIPWTEDAGKFKVGTAAALPVIVSAVTDEIRTLHVEGSRPDSEHYYCEPSECDRAGEGELRPYCQECWTWYPCPTMRLVDALDAEYGVTR